MSPIHPALVHFPVALLVAAVATEAIGAWRDDARWRFLGLVTLLGATAGANVAVMAGLYDMESLGDTHVDLVHVHMRIGLGLLAALIGLSVWRWRLRRREHVGPAYLIVAVVVLAGMGLQGFIGHELVFAYGLGMKAKSDGSGGDAPGAGGGDHHGAPPGASDMKGMEGMEGMKGMKGGAAPGHHGEAPAASDAEPAHGAPEATAGHDMPPMPSSGGHDMARMPSPNGKNSQKPAPTSGGHDMAGMASSPPTSTVPTASTPLPPTPPSPTGAAATPAPVVKTTAKPPTPPPTSSRRSDPASPLAATPPEHPVPSALQGGSLTDAGPAEAP